jgi:L-ribulose-5-phosphate 3-epimerase
MIKSISYWSMKDGLANTHPIEDALATARQAGFAGIELCMGTEGVLNTQTTQSECETIRGKVEASGLVAETLATGLTWGTNPTSNDAATRKRAIELNKAVLQRAAWLGVKSVLYVPGVVKSPISPDLVRYDKALEYAREGVASLLETAEKVGVELCVENVWNGLFYSPVEFASFIDSFKSEKLGIYFDIGNVLGYHQHPPHWIEIFGKRIRRVHIKDFKQSIGTLGGFCDLLAGDVPWAESMAALKAIGYNKTLVAEMMPWDAALLERTSAAMDKILAM